MDNKKVLVRVDNQDNRVNKKKPKASTPVKDSGPIVDPNLSHISSITGVSISCPGVAEKENFHNSFDAGVNSSDPLLLALLNQLSLKEHQNANELEDINKSIDEMKESMEKELSEVNKLTIYFKKISYEEQRHGVEKDMSQIATEEVEQLQQCLDPIFTIAKKQRNKLELKNITVLSEENKESFKEVLAEAESTMKSFCEGEDFEYVQKLANFLPTLLDAREKCDDATKQCNEISRSIERLLLHKETLETIREFSK